MEKCTYCVQRIRSAQIAAEIAGRPIRDGDVLTACQAVCPAEAIHFGDLNDQKSKVAQLRADSRNYSLLDEELATRPRTTYLQAIRNPNPDLMTSFTGAMLSRPINNLNAPGESRWAAKACHPIPKPQRRRANRRSSVRVTLSARSRTRSAPLC